MLHQDGLNQQKAAINDQRRSFARDAESMRRKQSDLQKLEAAPSTEQARAKIKLVITNEHIKKGRVALELKVGLRLTNEACFDQSLRYRNI